MDTWTAQTASVCPASETSREFIVTTVNKELMQSIKDASVHSLSFTWLWMGHASETHADQIWGFSPLKTVVGVCPRKLRLTEHVLKDVESTNTSLKVTETIAHVSQDLLSWGKKEAVSRGLTARSPTKFLIKLVLIVFVGKATKLIWTLKDVYLNVPKTKDCP